MGWTHAVPSPFAWIPTESGDALPGWADMDDFPENPSSWPVFISYPTGYETRSAEPWRFRVGESDEEGYGRWDPEESGR